MIQLRAITDYTNLTDSTDSIIKVMAHLETKGPDTNTEERAKGVQNKVE